MQESSSERKNSVPHKTDLIYEILQLTFSLLQDKRRRLLNSNGHRSNRRGHLSVYMALLAGGATLVSVWFLGSSSIRIFEIFEARTAVGGRSRTVYPFTDDLAVDLGSAYGPMRIPKCIRFCSITKFPLMKLTSL